MRFRDGAAFVVTAALLTGCSVEPRLTLYNETGAAISVRVMDRTDKGRDVGDVLVAIAPGRSQTLQGGRLRPGGLPIVIGDCTYTYPLVIADLERIKARGEHKYPIPLELTRDLTLRLRSNTLRDAGSIPAPGFLRRPLLKSCR